MVEEVRFMWCDALEEVLQCPICLEITPNNKIQCVNGHHICVVCRNYLQECPICKGRFLATRNLAVEQLTSRFLEIKDSLMDPGHALNRRLLTDRVCVETQTEGIFRVSIGCQTDDVPQSISPSPRCPQILSPKVGKGTYPCKIEACSMELPHGRMIGHLRQNHNGFLYEHDRRSIEFRRGMSLPYNPRREHDFAYYIKGMGLFFLHVSVRQRGDLAAIVQIVNSNDIGKQFTYMLEVGYGHNTKYYNGMVKSCRVRREQILSSEDYLHVYDDIMRRIVNSNTNAFSLNVYIKRKMYNMEAGDQNRPSTSTQS